MMDKAELRRSERGRARTGAEEKDLASRSLEIQLRFLDSFPPAPGGRVALYAAIRQEVRTDLIRARYSAAGVLLFYPRVMEDGKLSFYPDGGPEKWVRGKHGLMEPRISPGMEGLRNGLDLVVVPGIAFDAMGRRLGRGYGYYDRFLADLAGSAISVGLAYSRQLLPEVPVDAWDVPVDAVVTEDGVIRIPRARRDGHTK